MIIEKMFTNLLGNSGPNLENKKKGFLFGIYRKQLETLWLLPLRKITPKLFQMPKILKKSCEKFYKQGSTTGKAGKKYLFKNLNQENPSESILIFMEKKDKYSKLLQEGGLFFYGTTKGSF